MGFVHLHCHTEYSLLDGAIRIGDYIAKTQEYGQDSAAITDHGVLFGACEFHDKCRAKGLKPILGCEVYVSPRDMDFRQPIPGEPNYYHLVLLAQNSTGYHNLLKLVSQANVKGFYYKPRVDKKILSEFNEGIIALSACLQGEVPYNLLRGNEARAVEAVEFYRSTFDGRFYLELQENGIEDQNKVNPLIVDMARRYDLPMVATNDCHYLKREDARAHEALMCIQTRKTLLDNDRMKFETDQLYLKSPEQMAKDFSWIPEAVEMTGEVAAQCDVEIPSGNYYFPVYPTDDGKSLDDVIEELCWNGLERRLGDKADEEYRQRLETELDVIKTMGFPGYFLIVADYINWSKDNGVPVGPGRGSAAGSLAAYCMGITDIDPIRWNLLFERFLNPERKSMPDIDVDFCQAKRDQAIEYVKRRYGAANVGQITTFGNMKAKAVIRDVGRVMGMSFAEVNRIAKLIPNDLKMTLKQAMIDEPRLKELTETDPQVGKLMEIAMALEGLARHASVHAGGVVISDARPLTEHVPVYVDKKGMYISQYDKNYVERVGLIKFDLLGLKTLTVIDTALKILKKKGIDLDIGAVPIDDEATLKLMGDGDTASVFQLESSGMKQMLRQLKPSRFEDIIAAVALYRPGPMDLIPSYVERRHGREEVSYPHPLLEKILEETYGIIIYQEQVMQIAQVMAGYSLGRADLLRRAMGKKKLELMAEHRKIFVDGALERNVDAAKANEVFDLMEKFASYGFNKSHAAAYALVTFQTAFLKVHHFREFMAANLTLDLNNTDKVVGHIAECRSKGVPILSPDINESAWEFIPNDEGIRFGLGGIKNVGKGAVDELIADREKNGPFGDMQDFVDRCCLGKVNKRVVESLIKAGAFDSLHDNRRSMAEALDRLIEAAQKRYKDAADAQESLFSLEEFSADEPHRIELPDIPDWAESDRLKMEKATIGFYISGHPLNKYKDLMDRFATASTATLAEAGGKAIIAGILNAVTPMKTKRGDAMARAEIEDLDGTVPVVFFPQCFAEYRDVITGEDPVVIKATIKVTNEATETEDGEESSGFEAELFAEEVYAIEAAGETLARKLLVHLDGSAGKDSLRSIKQAVVEYRGSCTLCFEVETDCATVSIDAGRDFTVNPSRDLVSRMKAIVGPQHVEVR